MPVDAQGRCLATVAVQQVSGRWKAPVLDALRHGPRGFLALARSVEGISHRMLARTLRELVAAGLVDRAEPTGALGTVAYSLTDHGRRALGLLDQWVTPTTPVPPAH